MACDLAGGRHAVRGRQRRRCADSSRCERAQAHPPTGEQQVAEHGEEARDDDHGRWRPQRHQGERAAATSRPSRTPTPAGAGWLNIAERRGEREAARRQATSSGPGGASGPPTLRASTKVPSPDADPRRDEQQRSARPPGPTGSCSSGSRRSSRSPSAMTAFSSRGQQQHAAPAARPARTHHHENARRATRPSSATARAGRRGSPVSTARPRLTGADHGQRRRGMCEPGPHLGLGHDAPHRPGQVLAELPDEEDADGRRRGAGGVPRSASSTRQPSRVRIGARRDQRGRHQHDPRVDLAQVGRRPPPVRATARSRTAATMTTSQADAQRVERPGAGQRRSRHSAPPEGQAEHGVRRRRPGAPRCAASRIRSVHVAVEVADEDEAEVVGAGQDAAHVGRPDRALGGGRPERQR